MALPSERATDAACGRAAIDPPMWGNTRYGGRDAYNLAATALVAAKVYETYGWVRWNGHAGIPADHDEMHVPDAEALFKVLYDLSCLALERRGKDDVERQVGVLRFNAYADDDGEDSYVNVYLSIGTIDLDEIRALGSRSEFATAGREAAS